MSYSASLKYLSRLWKLNFSLSTFLLPLFSSTETRREIQKKEVSTLNVMVSAYHSVNPSKILKNDNGGEYKLHRGENCQRASTQVKEGNTRAPGWFS